MREKRIERERKIIKADVKNKPWKNSQQYAKRMTQYKLPMQIHW